MTYITTITEEDIGKTVIERPHNCECPYCNGITKIPIHEVLGRVLLMDVGKQIHKVNGVLYVESMEEYKKRIGKKEV